MKNVYIFFIAFLLVLVSCKDIQETEPDYKKLLITTKLSSVDSLNFLQFTQIDLGTVRMMSTLNQSISIKNTSAEFQITLYSLTGKNPSGLFSYYFPSGLPFSLNPGEDSGPSGKIELKFIANVFVIGMYYDTLVINKNEQFNIPIKVKVIY